MTGPGPTLDPFDADYLFEAAIWPRFEDMRPSAGTPIAAIVAGQPGAGKSRFEDDVFPDMSRGGRKIGIKDVARIDADVFRDAHPHWKRLSEYDDKTAAAQTQPVVGRWVDEAVERVAERRLDALVSATLKRPESLREKAGAFRRKGYYVMLVCIGTHEAQSRLGILTRYATQRDESTAANYLPARYVPPDVHDEAYRKLPDVVDDAETETSGIVDEFLVFYRGANEPSFGATREPHWSETGFREALRKARARRWGLGDVVKFGDDCRGLALSTATDLRTEVIDASSTLFCGDVCLPQCDRVSAPPP